MESRNKAEPITIRSAFSEPVTFASAQSEFSAFYFKDLNFELPNVINTSRNINPLPESSSNKELLKKIHKKSTKRAISAHALGNKTSSPYNKNLYLLANDEEMQKEVSLGRRIGLYKIGKELGSGNFSKVKLAMHVLANEKVAIKIMDKSKMDQKAKNLLGNEVTCMENLNHRNIIRLFECIESLSRTFLVMEYADGGDLHAYLLTKGRLDEDESRSIFAQVISAVFYMHDRGIVHRDIKAENIIFAQFNVIKLVDFGFSCSYVNNETLGTFCGSPPYAAPELYKDLEYSGVLVDIWAMGILLYFMLTGIMPFRGDTLNDLKNKIIEGYFTIPSYLSSLASDLLMRLLEKDCKSRATLHEIQTSQWLGKGKFNEVHSNIEELYEKTIHEGVIIRLAKFGIDSEMVKDAIPKGCRNAIVGLYRILFQQILIEKTNRLKFLETGDSTSQIKRSKLVYRSTTCELI